eukprot:TRINITY_DN8031_c6_g1_i1.p1 TRINITY_DN8031_c6_g1~~TRINITY_DN8031_c6_g1_i1.p1  ORF type:complete len:812 (+),score=269.74 TRINITY_DN8031_c6_g1_i1:71-2437(+)
MAEYFEKMEEADGIRWSWHYFPNRKPGSSAPSGENFIQPDMVVPLGCMLTPLKYIPDMPVIHGRPPRCRQCGAVSNRFCRVDQAGKYWMCPFCLMRNSFAQDEAPAVPHTGTVEYVLPVASPGNPPVFIFMLDVVQTVEELDAAKDALTQSLARLPENCMVGLVTFGRNVSVWELGSMDSVRAVVLAGERRDAKATYTIDAVREYLGIRPQTARGDVPACHSVQGRFVVPLTSDTEQLFGSILDDLSIDPWPSIQSERRLRATGAALEITAAMVELLSVTPEDRWYGRLMMFLSGPCCRGPGKVVDVSEEKTLRTHKDVADGQAQLMEPATVFGDALGKRLLKANFCLDMFICALDQVGLAELAAATVYTGGRITCSDSFKGVKHDGSRASTPVFKTSFAKFFDKAVSQPQDRDVSNMFFSAITEVQTCSNSKILGCIGPVVGSGKMSASVHPDFQVGDGGTCAWSTSVMDQDTTLSFVFDSTDHEGAVPVHERCRYMQFITSYRNTAGEYRVRVMTSSNRIAPAADRQTINQVFAFDQFAAGVLCGRMAAKSMEKSGNKFTPTLRWVDRLLIRFVKKFAEYRPNDPNSLVLAQMYTLFPQFMYHLRRSEFLQVFNCSPDETVWFRHLLHREPVQNALVMVQPSLRQYEYGSCESTPVMLDSQSVKTDTILLCDAYFDVIVHHGRQLAEWRKKDFHAQADYAAFAAQLQAPHAEVERIVKSRFPCPKVTICDQNGSQARYLYSRLNPTDTMRDRVEREDVQIIHTEDANVQTFMAHLRKLVVAADEKR